MLKKKNIKKKFIKLNFKKFDLFYLQSLMENIRIKSLCCVKFYKIYFLKFKRYVLRFYLYNYLYNTSNYRFFFQKLFKLNKEFTPVILKTAIEKQFEYRLKKYGKVSFSNFNNIYMYYILKCIPFNNYDSVEIVENFLKYVNVQEVRWLRNCMFCKSKE